MHVPSERPAALSTLRLLLLQSGLDMRPSELPDRYDLVSLYDGRIAWHQCSFEGLLAGPTKTPALCLS